MFHLILSMYIFLGSDNYVNSILFWLNRKQPKLLSKYYPNYQIDTFCLFACLLFSHFGLVMPLFLLPGQLGVTWLFNCRPKDILATRINSLSLKLLQTLE